MGSGSEVGTGEGAEEGRRAGRAGEEMDRGKRTRCGPKEGGRGEGWVLQDRKEEKEPHFTEIKRQSGERAR